MKALFLLFVAALAFAACHHQPTNPFFRSEVTFVYRVNPPAGLTQDLITVQWSDERDTHTLLPEHFAATSSYATPHTENFPTAKAGKLTVHVVLARGADTIASGSATVPLKEDWIWGFSFELGNRDPTYGCFGCAGYVGFKAAPNQAGDSLFIVWGGNYISNPVVY